MKKILCILISLFITISFSCDLLREKTVTDFVLEIPEEVIEEIPGTLEDPYIRRVECTIKSSDGTIEATLKKTLNDKVKIGNNLNGRPKYGYSFMFKGIPIGQTFDVTLSIINDDVITFQQEQNIKITSRVTATNITLKEYYNIGDYILANGSLLRSNETNYTGYEPIAVIFRPGKQGEALGVGLEQTQTEWITKFVSTQPYYEQLHELQSLLIESTISTPRHIKNLNRTGFHWASPTYPMISGDLDGSDNFVEVKREVISQNINPKSHVSIRIQQQTLNTRLFEEGYWPAFDFANNYRTTYNPLSDYSTGWYIPSIHELTDLYNQKDAVNQSLSSISGTTLNKDIYLSSSQNSYSATSNMAISFTEKKYVSFPKTTTGTEYEGNSAYVRVIHKF